MAQHKADHSISSPADCTTREEKKILQRMYIVVNKNQSSVQDVRR